MKCCLNMETLLGKFLRFLVMEMERERKCPILTVQKVIYNIANHESYEPGEEYIKIYRISNIMECYIIKKAWDNKDETTWTKQAPRRKKS